MDTINKNKQALINAYKQMPEDRRKTLRDWFSTTHDVIVQNKIIRDAKKDAEDIIDYADRQDYGYGEVYFNLNEQVAEFAEDIPELEKEYKRMVYAYFELLTEAKTC